MCADIRILARKTGAKGTCFLREPGLESEVWTVLTAVGEGLSAVHLGLLGSIWPGTFYLLLSGPRGRCRISWEEGRGKRGCARVVLVLATWRGLCLHRATNSLWRKGRMVQEKHFCSRTGPGEMMQWVCEEDCFCYSVISMTLGINQQVLRSTGSWLQTEVLRWASWGTFCFGLFLAKTLSVPAMAKPLC